MDDLKYCGCLLGFFIANLICGGWSVNYLLSVFFEKTIPWVWAIIIGLFAGEFTIPVAVVVAILRALGVL